MTIDPVAVIRSMERNEREADYLRRLADTLPAFEARKIRDRADSLQARAEHAFAWLDDVAENYKPSHRQRAA